jgi:hypothetical protein
MPGFRNPFISSPQDGLNTKDAKAETRRKHRWIFTVLWDGGAGLNSSSVYLQKAQRPHVVIETPEMHHDQEQAYFAGKHHWEPINLVFYDTTAPIDSGTAIYAWLRSCVDVENATVEIPAVYKKNSQLSSTTGQGAPSESWQIYNGWPADVNWNDTDYTNTDIQTIDVVLKYDRAQRTFPTSATV